MPRIRPPHSAQDQTTNAIPDVIEDDLDRPNRDLDAEAPADASLPTVDGGNPDHPVHDEDQEDKMPEDFEREIDRSDAPVDKVVQ